MSDARNKLQCRKNNNHRKILDLAVDLDYLSFSHPNPTHLPKHQTLCPNHQFSQRIWYVEYHFVHVHMEWGQKFRKSEISLDTGNFSNLRIRILFRLRLQSSIQPKFTHVFTKEMTTQTPATAEIEKWLQIRSDFSQSFDSGSGSERKTQNPAEVDSGTPDP